MRVKRGAAACTDEISVVGWGSEGWNWMEGEKEEEDDERELEEEEAGHAFGGVHGFAGTIETELSACFCLCAFVPLLWCVYM